MNHHPIIDEYRELIYPSDGNDEIIEVLKDRLISATSIRKLKMGERNMDVSAFVLTLDDMLKTSDEFLVKPMREMMAAIKERRSGKDPKEVPLEGVVITYLTLMRVFNIKTDTLVTILRIVYDHLQHAEQHISLEHFLGNLTDEFHSRIRLPDDE